MAGDHGQTSMNRFPQSIGGTLHDLIQTTRSLKTVMPFVNLPDFCYP